MNLETDTGFPMELMTIQLPRGTWKATLIVKQTFDLAPDGTLHRAAIQLPIASAPTETHYGRLGGDLFPRKRGVDLCILGTVRRQHPVRQALLTLRLGNFTHRLRISGDRWWARSGGDVAMTDPQPFTELTLNWQRSFGGLADPAEPTSAWPDNPLGTGLCTRIEDAHGRRLPNVEAADAPPIATWRDRPRVAGWGPYPFTWGLRLPQCMDAPTENRRGGSMRAEIFNSSHPDLTLPAVATGESVIIDGLHEQPSAFACLLNVSP